MKLQLCQVHTPHGTPAEVRAITDVERLSTLLFEASNERGAMAEPLWLTDEQQHAWRRLAAVLLKLPVEMDRQLQQDADMTHFEYWVIAMLSEAPDRRLQLKDLAQRINSSASRLSHVMRRLEDRGWVRRETNPDDARANDAILTDEGFDKVVATAPGHVETVRHLVFERLSEDDIADLARVCDRILEQLECGPQAGR